MDPATIAFIIWVISFLLAKKGGLSNTQAALAATGAAAAGYYVANGNSFTGNTQGTDVGGATSSVSTVGGGSVFGSLGTAAAGVGSWVAANPGTAAAIVGAGTLGATASSSLSKMLPWLLAAGAFIIIAK